MGSDFCTCLSDLTSPESEDLSRGSNGKKIDNHPKIVLNNNSTIDSVEPMSSQRDKDSKYNTLSSTYKNSTKASISNSNYKQSQNEKKKIMNLKNNLSNKKNNNYNSNKNRNNKNNKKNNSIEKAPSVKKLLEKGLVSKEFKNFFNSQKGQEMTLNMNEHHNKLCISLHKYLVSLITKREFKKNIKYYLEEGDKLYKRYLEEIYNLNKNLKNIEMFPPIKYAPDGYLKYYSEKKDIEKMKYNNPKECFDNCIIVNYSDNNPSSPDNMIWIYKGQVNKEGQPHGFGEKIFKKGVKQKGYWKNGEMYGWGEEIDNQGNITIGPFYDNSGITGMGEKFVAKKKVLYKGEFVKGEKSGKGEEISNEGQFIGEFYKNKKYGKGKMIYKISGDIYEGEYKDDLFDGNGHYIWKATGQEYKGEYKKGVMHGKGLYEWSDGEFYRGNFVNGQKEGEGELHLGNGRSFIGPFSNGRPNGIGIFNNGINFKGEMEFIDGKMNINYMKRKYTNSSFSTINIDNKSENNNNGDELK